MMMKISIRTLMTSVICSFIAQASQGGLILELNTVQQVSGPEITLKDIVKDPTSLPDSWKERSVMKAPTSEMPVEYGIASIAYALQKYPDMKDVTLRGEPRMSVSRIHKPLDTARIEKAISKYTENNEPWKGKRFEIRCDQGAGKIPVYGENAELLVIKAKTLNAADNKHIFTLSIPGDTESNQTFDVTATVLPLSAVWVAKKTIGRGQPLSPVDNIEIQFLPDDQAGSLIPATESIDGFELSNTVSANQPVNRHFLIQPTCSQNGEQINVSVDRGSLRVLLRAKALSTGRKGERIMCMNEQSKRRLLVRLTGPREATMDF